MFAGMGRNKLFLDPLRTVCGPLGTFVFANPIGARGQRDSRGLPPEQADLWARHQASIPLLRSKTTTVSAGRQKDQKTG